MDENSEFYVEKNNKPLEEENGRKVIDESKYKIRAKKANEPSAVGRGGDPLFLNVRATKEQLSELLDETTIVQDWIQRETSNNVALSCLDNENLKEIYYEIKDGFGEYGPIMLMGFKNPMGVEIPRLKILDKDGEVIEVLTGPLAMDELNRRAIAFRESIKDGVGATQITETIQDYSGNPEDYS